MRWVVIPCLVFIAVLVGGKYAKSDDYREYQKQMLRLSYTEFCATVGPPPQVIANALNEAMKQDPKTWLAAVLWWNQIADKYKEAKCGDS
jgi:hypothetical protein